MTAPDFQANSKCQEVIMMIGDQYVRCDSPTSMVIQHRGRSEGPYYMCLACGTHNAHNRNAEVLAVRFCPHCHSEELNYVLSEGKWIRHCNNCRLTECVNNPTVASRAV